MNIFILAAGRGTRLGAHNKNNPKCLFKIDNISLIERNLILFRKARLNPILITGYEKQKLNYLNLKSVYNSEYLETNTIQAHGGDGAIACKHRNKNEGCGNQPCALALILETFQERIQFSFIAR